MKIPQTRVQKIKAGLHCAQGATTLIGAILALVVLTEPGGLSGQVGYLFGLCFLTVPALIYQIMVPMWTRAWRFNNAYFFAAIDVLFVVFWFAAFIAVAVWRSNGINTGKSKDNADGARKEDGSCSQFAYGSASKCETALALVLFGVVVCLLFCATAYLSFRAVFEFKRTGTVSGGQFHAHGRAEDLDPTKDAWSTNVDELDSHQASDPDDEDHHSSRILHGQLSDDEAEYGLLNILHAPQHDKPFRDGEST